MTTDYIVEMMENLFHCWGQLFLSIFGIIYYSMPFIIIAIFIVGFIFIIKDTKLVRAIVWHIKNRNKGDK